MPLHQIFHIGRSTRLVGLNYFIFPPLRSNQSQYAYNRRKTQSKIDDNLKVSLLNCHYWGRRLEHIVKMHQLFRSIIESDSCLRVFATFANFWQIVSITFQLLQLMFGLKNYKFSNMFLCIFSRSATFVGSDIQKKYSEEKENCNSD